MISWISSSCQRMAVGLAIYPQLPFDCDPRFPRVASNFLLVLLSSYCRRPPLVIKGDQCGADYNGRSVNQDNFHFFSSTPWRKRFLWISIKENTPQPILAQKQPEVKSRPLSGPGQETRDDDIDWIRFSGPNWKSKLLLDINDYQDFLTKVFCY